MRLTALLSLTLATTLGLGQAIMPCMTILPCLQPAVAAAHLAEKAAKEPSKQGYCRFATINGDKIVFCSEDDLWLVSTEGGIARRLTAGKGVSSMPRLSPDGRLVAFVCTEEGNPEIYVMPAEGGAARRLTHMGASSATISGWTADGREILFASSSRASFGKATELFAISAGGGMPGPLNLGDAMTVSISKNGAVALGRNNLDPARWKRYHGGTAGELWAAPSVNSDFKPLISLKGNLVWPMWINDRVYFLSDHEGVGNIYSCTAAGGDLQRHTNEVEYYVRFPSTDGKRIVYTAGARVYVFDPASNTTKSINIEAPSNLTQAKRKFIESKEYLEQFSVHPKGHSVGLIVRGQAFSMPLFEGAAVHHGIASKVRYEQFHWLPEGDRFAVVTDAPGYHQIEIHRLDQSQPPKVVTEGDIGRITSMIVSPTRDRIAFANQRHDVYILDYESKKLQKIDHSPADRVSGMAWSPDGRWLAYNYAETDSAGIIKIAEAETGTTHDVTSVVRLDYAPAFDPDGKYLYFLSRRDYHPVHDQVQFDWSFPMASRPFLVTLAKNVTSPLVPKVRPFIKGGDDEGDKENKDNKDDQEDKKPGEKESKDKEPEENSKQEEVSEKGDEKEGEKPKGNKAHKKKITDVKIDFDGISGRILALPVEQGNYGQIIGMAKGRVIYTRYPVKPVSPHTDWLKGNDDAGVLAAYDFEQQKETVIEQGVMHVSIAADNRTLIARSKRGLRVIDARKKFDDSKREAAAEAGRESGWIDLNRVKVLVEPTVEWLQMYREAWRLQKENFWAADMSRVDWDLVRKRYEVLLPLVRSRGELSDLIWEMQGELGTSHAYEMLGDYEAGRSYKRGFLGADLSYDGGHGGYRIDKILRGDSWEADADSPLAEPGLNISEGDVITAVGGHPVSADLSVDELLLDQAGERVLLTIVSQDHAAGSNNKPKRVAVKTLRSESALRYRSWVEANRKLVHEHSNGQLGYVHIPDMGVQGFSEFHRGFLAEYRYPGLIVDVRYNGGGNVSPLLLEKLLRKQIGFGVPRWGLPEPYPRESISGPLVAVTNQFAGSDGDIFSHAFKQYKMGPLIGKRTWGGVVGISANRTLVDGTLTTQPEFAFWFSDVGWNVENYGVDPDEIVEITPQDFKAKRDPQLDRAVELGLTSLRSKPVILPDFEKRPAKLLPTSLAQ